MIGKVKCGSGVKGCLAYNLQGHQAEAKQAKTEALLTGEPYHPRGEILYFQKCNPESIEALTKDFVEIRKLNPGLKNYVWHQSFSFPRHENPTNALMVNIARDAAGAFGFEENQYIVFRHTDKQHHHFHIVANRMNEQGKTTVSDGRSYARTGTFCREMERKYGLTTVEDMTINQRKEERLSEKRNERAQELKRSVDQVLPFARSLDDFADKMSLYNFKVLTGRGVVFVDELTGARFKGSALGREYSRANLEKRLGQQTTHFKELEPAEALGKGLGREEKEPQDGLVIQGSGAEKVMDAIVEATQQESQSPSNPYQQKPKKRRGLSL